jgi:hypothetical protein
MKFSWEDTKVENDKSYSYVIISAAVDTDNLSKITSNVKTSDQLITTRAGIKTYTALSADESGINGSGEFSTEISVTPKSVFKANITGANRCRNYRCSFDIETSEEITLNLATVPTAKTTGIQLKNAPIPSTLKVSIQTDSSTIDILNTDYSFFNEKTIIFSRFFGQPGDKLKFSYSYRQYTKSKEVQEMRRISVSNGDGNLDTGKQLVVYTSHKLLVQGTFNILVAKIDETNQDVNAEVYSVNELNGIVEISIDPSISATGTLVRIYI